LTVRFTPQAQDDLTAIRDWIVEDHAWAVERVVSWILRRAMMFGQFPPHRPDAKG
jgi:plasmid stabilization system protein ParE